MSGKGVHSLAKRFWKKVDRRGPDECWPWTAGRHRQGYGLIGLTGMSTLAHRVAYTLVVGPIPDGLLVRHRCDNPPCCNPAHLELGTQTDNMRDAAVRGRNTARLTAGDVAHIRVWARAGFKQRDIAEAYGVTQSNVSMIVAGKTWNYVTGAQAA